MAPPSQAVVSQLPFLYKLYFCFWEPLTALNGAYLLYFKPATYLRMTHSPGPAYTADTVPESTVHVASHLVGLYILFALIEATVPRITTDMKIYKTLLMCYLACDAAYISTLVGTGGSPSYWVSPWLWDLTAWGNFGSSWAAPIVRTLFLLEVGVPRQRGQAAARA